MDASVATDDDFGAGRGSLSPTSFVADLMANCDAAVDKFSVSISSFLSDVKMGCFYRSLLILYFICILLSYCCLLGLLNLMMMMMIKLQC